MSYSKRKVSSQEKSLSVYFASAKSYFSFDSQAAAFRGERRRRVARQANGEVGGEYGGGKCDRVFLVLLKVT